MKVLLIDDHALFRIGLAELLERRGVQVLAATGECAAGIAQVCELSPDVILLDMRMPEMTGLEVLKQLRQQDCHMPVVILTTSREENDVVQSLQNGANGYLLKDMEPDDLIKSLQEIMQGRTVVAPELAGVLARVVQGDNTPQSAMPEKNLAELTKREREILCLLVDGQSNKVIARNLGISDGTVKLHVKAILRKLDVHSRVEAAVMAVEQSLCPRESFST
jgi:two-component system nitrate/nitrite response regulator NarL